MIIEFASALDPGRVRRNNEDAVAVDPETGVAVLADGMGGYLAGEVASGMATSIISQEMVRWMRGHNGARPPEGDVRHIMDSSTQHANRAIYESSHSNPKYSGMGTTLVMTVPCDRGLMVGHVGDSRAYRFRKGQLERLSKDHSFLQEQLDLGLITPEQAAKSMHRNLVTRAMGVEPDVLLELNLFDVQSDDLIMLCSDGLTDMLDDARLQELLSMPLALQEMCLALVAAANEAGGRDNISVVLARIRSLNAEVPAAKSWWQFGRAS